MQIETINQQSMISIDLQSVKKIVRFLLIALKVQCDEVAIHFVDKETICHLHDKFFDDPTPTDCITFPIDDKTDSSFYRMLGEVFVCPEVAIEYAEQHKIDPKDEICLYVIHGLLHLLGYDDIEEDDRQIMRKKEEWCMNQLKGKKIKLQTLHANPSY